MGNILLIGLGRVGLRTLNYLLALNRNLNIYVVDVDPSKSKEVIGLGNVEFHRFSPEIIKGLSKKCDIAVSALPSIYAFKLITELISECINVVDVSFIREDPYVLEPLVSKCGNVFIPDAGFAPGYSNLVVSYVQSVFNELESVEVMAGGIPERPVPPLGYVVTWNPADLIEEYIRPSRIVKDGRYIEVDPLSEVIEVSIDGVGKLEGFISDGLRTLLRNIRARNMREITLRWPGHIGIMKVLRDLGLMSYDPLEVDGAQVTPAKLLAKLFEKKLSAGVKDLAVLNIVVRDISGKEYMETAVLRGTINEPALPKFTALVHAYTSWLVIRGVIKPGIHPLEDLYSFKEEYQRYLQNNGVEVKIQIKD